MDGDISAGKNETNKNTVIRKLKKIITYFIHGGQQYMESTFEAIWTWSRVNHTNIFFDRRAYHIC